MLHTISALASAGAATNTIEGQTFPKKCTISAGNGVRIIEREDAVGRVRGALRARDWYSPSVEGAEGNSDEGEGVWIVARTDCRLSNGFQEVIKRCLRFQQLGADIVYAENLQSVEEYQELRERLDERTVTMVAQVQEEDVWTTMGANHQTQQHPDGKPLLTIHEIGELGYDLALSGVTINQIHTSHIMNTSIK